MENIGQVAFQMPFKPTMPLIITELAFRKHLKAIAQNEEACRLSLPEVIILKKSHIVESELDKQNEYLIDFYNLIIQVINKSVLIKHRHLNKLSPQTDKNKQELHILQTNIVTYATNLEQEQPVLWEYLLSHSTGRHALYYLITSNLIHSNAWQLENTLTHWISALIKTCTDTDESHVLAYLLNLNNTQLNIQNPFTQIQTLLNSTHENETIDVKIATVKKHTLTPLTFGRNTPSFIVHLIQMSFAYHALMHIAHHIDKLPQFLNLIQDLSQAQYLPAIPKTMQGNTANHALSQICHVYEIMHVFSFYYTLYIDQNIILTPWHGSLMHMHVYLFSHMKDIEISAETNLSLAVSAINLIQKNLVKITSEYSEGRQVFWKTVAKIFTPTGDVKADFIKFFSEHINTIIEHLYQQNMEDESYQILCRLLKYQAHCPSITALQLKQYHSLTSAIRFISLLAPHELAHAKHLSELLKYIKTTPSYFETPDLHFVNKYFKDLATALKSKLLERISLIQTTVCITDLTAQDNEARYQLQKYAFQLASLLGTEAATINKLQSELGYDDYLLFQITDLIKEDQTTSATKNKKKTASKKSFTASHTTVAVSALSMFKAETKYNIARNKLPIALLELACEIKRMTQQELIITGGAVTSLLLGQDKAHDYDCLIFDVDKVSLLELLKSAGFIHCQLIGKHYPIIKLKLIEGEQTLEVDISTAPSEGLNLHKAMAEILAKRDFKLSALYIVLASNQDAFEVKGFGQSIRSVNHQRISVVNHRETIFQEDPIRLLRLIKIMLQYPDFSIDDKLALILRNSNLKTCFNDFLKQKNMAVTNQGRLGTAIEALFARFDMRTVMHKMGELGIIEGMTGLKSTNILANLNIFDAYDHAAPYIKKMIFYQFIYIHHCLTLQDHKELVKWPFYKVARHLLPEHRLYFDLIEQQILKVEARAFVVAPKVLEMIEHIKNQQQQAAACPSESLSMLP